MPLRITILFIVSFLCTTAVAQMDKDGNFHWDELYTSDEVLELDMSLPNKVDVSAIKNRERVKYVKLKCYPWIEHIPFIPEDFPNIEALRIETYLLVDLRNLELFTGLKRLDIETAGEEACFYYLQQMFPQPYAKRIWSLCLLEELKVQGSYIIVNENTLSKLPNLRYLDGYYTGPFVYEELKKMKSLQQYPNYKYLLKGRETINIQEPFKRMYSDEKLFGWSGSMYRDVYYNNAFGEDTTYWLQLIPDNFIEGSSKSLGRGFCNVADTINISQFGTSYYTRESKMVSHGLCIYSPSQKRITLFYVNIDKIPFKFVILDLKENKLIDITPPTIDQYADLRFNYIIDCNTVYNYSWSGCNKITSREFDYFEYSKDNTKIYDYKNKSVQISESIVRDYKQQIEFAKSLNFSMDNLIFRWNDIK